MLEWGAEMSPSAGHVTARPRLRDIAAPVSGSSETRRTRRHHARLTGSGYVFAAADGAGHRAVRRVVQQSLAVAGLMGRDRFRVVSARPQPRVNNRCAHENRNHLHIGTLTLRAAIADIADGAA